MAAKPVKDIDPHENLAKPVDEVRAKFLAALAKKQDQQKGGVSGRGGGKSRAQGASEGHTQRHFQRKSGAS